MKKQNNKKRIIGIQFGKETSSTGYYNFGKKKVTLCRDSIGQEHISTSIRIQKTEKGQSTFSIGNEVYSTTNGTILMGKGKENDNDKLNPLFTNYDCRRKNDRLRILSEEIGLNQIEVMKMQPIGMRKYNDNTLSKEEMNALILYHLISMQGIYLSDIERIEGIAIGIPNDCDEKEKESLLVGCEIFGLERRNVLFVDESIAPIYALKYNNDNCQILNNGEIIAVIDIGISSMEISYCNYDENNIKRYGSLKSFECSYNKFLSILDEFVKMKINHYFNSIGIEMVDFDNVFVKMNQNKKEIYEKALESLYHKIEKTHEANLSFFHNHY